MRAFELAGWLSGAKIRQKCWDDLTTFWTWTGTKWVFDDGGDVDFELYGYLFSDDDWELVV